MISNKYDSKISGTECSKNNMAWNAVFDKLPILSTINSDGLYHITADELSKYGNRQSQLMTKIESIHNLPYALSENNLCIIPNNNHEDYVIGYFDAFQDIDFEPSKLKAKFVEVDRCFDTLNPFNIQREPSAILASFNNHILDNIIGDPTPELRMTNFGRIYTEPFEFNINNKNDGKQYTIKVEKSQLEIDGIFESDDCVINIEAKNGLRTNFLTGQLYYPFRYLENQTSKEIVNILLTYSMGSIFAHVFHVDKVEEYNSMQLVSSHRYDFYEGITVTEVAKLIHETESSPDPLGLIVPQANSIQKIFDSLEIINHTPGITDNELSYELSIANRQGGYYGNACNYLGLTDRKTNGGTTIYNYISRTGRAILELPYKARILAIIKQMLRHEVFSHFLSEYLEQLIPPTTEEIKEWLKEHIPEMKNNSTPERRSSTIKNWITWVIDTCNADE